MIGTKAHSNFIIRAAAIYLVFIFFHVFPPAAEFLGGKQKESLSLMGGGDFKSE